MEEKEPKNQSVEEQQKLPSYIPRPRWQVWGARIGLVLFVILIILYYINISRGGI